MSRVIADGLSKRVTASTAEALAGTADKFPDAADVKATVDAAVSSLGTAVTRDVGTNDGNVIVQGTFGATILKPGVSSEDLDVVSGGANTWNRRNNASLLLTNLNNALAFHVSSTQNDRVATIQAGHATVSFANTLGTLRLNPFGGSVTINGNAVHHTGNTTVDSNGFLKHASPIIKLHSDRIESNNDEAPSFERIDTGHYRLSNTNGLRLDEGWYLETPHDRNGNKYFNVEWEQSSEPETDAGVLEEQADVTLTVRCYERVWNPQTGTYDNGDPVDIPDGRWIDLRMNEVRQPDPVEESQ